MDVFDACRTRRDPTIDRPVACGAPRLSSWQLAVACGRHDQQTDFRQCHHHLRDRKTRFGLHHEYQPQTVNHGLAAGRIAIGRRSISCPSTGILDRADEPGRGIQSIRVVTEEP